METEKKESLRKSLFFDRHLLRPEHLKHHPEFRSDIGTPNVANRALYASRTEPNRSDDVRKTKRHPSGVFCVLEAPPGIGPGNKGFADLCLTAWLWRHLAAGIPAAEPIGDPVGLPHGTLTDL